MKSRLKIYTAFASRSGIEKIKDAGYLVIYAIRGKNLKDLGLTNYTNSIYHFKNLAPSDSLIGELNAGDISFEEFEKKYVIELSKISIQDVIRKLEHLGENYKGVVIVTNRKKLSCCYRKALSLVLNTSKYLTETVEEYDM